MGLRFQLLVAFRRVTPLALLVACAGLTGCISSLGQPDRVFAVESEVSWLQTEDPTLRAAYMRNKTIQNRNEYIAGRMYAIDLGYTSYEAALTHEGQEANFLGAVTSLGLSTAATTIPVVQTAHLLTAIDTGVKGTTLAYNEKILLNQTMQHIQTGMRTARYEQANVILRNMQCPLESYPLTLALSDLELYYRAGTLTSGLMKVTEKVSGAAAEAKSDKDTRTAPGTAAMQNRVLEINRETSSSPCIALGPLDGTGQRMRLRK